MPHGPSLGCRLASDHGDDRLRVRRRTAVRSDRLCGAQLGLSPYLPDEYDALGVIMADEESEAVEECRP